MTVLASIYGQGPYPCPTCGHLTMKELPGSHQICPVCFWQDDEGGIVFALVPGGPNDLSLLESQKNFSAFGAMDERFRKSVRTPIDAQAKDKYWRPIDMAVDVFAERSAPVAWPDDARRLYYWVADYFFLEGKS